MFGSTVFEDENSQWFCYLMQIPQICFYPEDLKNENTSHKQELLFILYFMLHSALTRVYNK